MKNMKYIGVFAALLMLFACNRTEMPQTEAGQPSDARMTFKASLAPMTRSHFGASEATDGTLYWDSSDKVLIASVLQGTTANFPSDFSHLLDEYLLEISQGYGANETYVGAKVEKYIHTALATPTIDPSDPTKAVLTAPVTPKQLMPERNEVEDAYYEFIAIYPMPDTRPLTMMFWEGDEPGHGAAVGYPIEIPHVQNGKDYGSYHICFDSGIDMDKNLWGIYRAADILDENSNVEVSFTNLKPATSMLRFDMKSNSTEDVYIKKLVISLDSQNDKLSGDAYISAWGPDVWIVPNGWGDAKTYNDVVLEFDEAVKVTKDGTGEIFYAVVEPSFKDGDAPQCANQYGAADVHFYAYDANDNLVFRATKTAPSGDKPGFRAGERYDFTLELEKETPPDGALSGQFSIAEGKKAYIATSNLWAYVTNGVRDTNFGLNGWKLAEHQYDFIGSAANWANFDSYTGWIDLFGFSTTANDHGITVSTDDTVDYGGTDAGWTDCMAAASWRTITADEGVYLFMQRKNAAYLFAMGTVYVGPDNEKIKGLIFLPDDFVTPDGCSFQSMGSRGFNWNSYEWYRHGMTSDLFDSGNNTYNADGASNGSGGDWADMEAAGAVFWPMAGIRDGSTVTYGGAYWSGSSENDNENADVLLFADGGYFWAVADKRHIGGCVRLVRDVTE